MLSKLAKLGFAILKSDGKLSLKKEVDKMEKLPFVYDERCRNEYLTARLSLCQQLD